MALAWINYSYGVLMQFSISSIPSAFKTEVLLWGRFALFPSLFLSHLSISICTFNSFIIWGKIWFYPYLFCYFLFWLLGTLSGWLLCSFNILFLFAWVFLVVVLFFGWFLRISLLSGLREDPDSSCNYSPPTLE